MWWATFWWTAIKVRVRTSKIKTLNLILCRHFVSGSAPESAPWAKKNWGDTYPWRRRVNGFGWKNSSLSGTSSWFHQPAAGDKKLNLLSWRAPFLQRSVWLSVEDREKKKRFRQTESFSVHCYAKFKWYFWRCAYVYARMELVFIILLVCLLHPYPSVLRPCRMVILHFK